MIILAIDPGVTGSASIIWHGKLFLYISFKHCDTWKQKLYRWCFEYVPDLIVIEEVHAMPGQGVSSMFTFGEAFGSAKTALEIAGVSYSLIDPKTWQYRLPLPRRREIIDPAKRRTQRRKDQKELAIKLFPELSNVKGDVFASVLIGYSCLEKQDVLKDIDG